MKLKYFLFLFTLILALSFSTLLAQEEEPIIYFQMEPLDDSLFINIQETLFIDPPDPKAEIIADLRDQNNQTLCYPAMNMIPGKAALALLNTL